MELLKSFAIIFVIVLGFTIAVAGGWKLGLHILKLIGV